MKVSRPRFKLSSVLVSRKANSIAQPPHMSGVCVGPTVSQSSTKEQQYSG